MLIKDTFAAGETKEYFEENDFFRVLEATGEMTLFFYFNGKEVARADKVKEGYAEKFLIERYNKVKIKNETTGPQTIQFVGRLGHEVEYNKTPVGDVNIKNTGGAFTQIQKTVDVANTLLDAATPLRRYLLIQNNDQAATIFVTLDGSVATATNGIKLSPSQSLELDNYVPTGAINAISTVLTSSILFVEG